MKKIKRKFFESNNCRGTVLMEFLLTVALAGTLLPFVYQYQQRAILRAENIRVTRQMDKIKSALEGYIADNKDKMLTTIGRNIIRLKLSDLTDYGLDETFVQEMSDKYQLRILKSIDKNDQAALQGVIVYSDSEITPMRTREIVSLGDDKIGFVDGARAYGGFGTWRTDVASLGIDATSGIVQTTNANRDNSLYLWRVPSDSAADATMLSGLNLGMRDITNIAFANANGLRIDEVLNVNNIDTRDLIFDNQTILDSNYKTRIATVTGTLSGDAKNIVTKNVFNLSEYGKFSELATDNLWVNDLVLSGLSTDSNSIAILRANQTLDMTEGRITALYVTVGFAGSLTSRLTVREKIIDSENSNYFWDVKNGIANLNDINSPTLTDLGGQVLRRESVSGSASTRIFSSVVANKNATMSDYMNAIHEIQNSVQEKYRLLNLQ